MKKKENVLLLGIGLLGVLRKEARILEVLKKATEHSGDKKGE